MKKIDCLIVEDLGFKVLATIIENHDGVKVKHYDTGEIRIVNTTYILWSCYDPDGDLIGEEFADDRFNSFEKAHEYLKSNDAKLLAFDILSYLVKKENEAMISFLN